MPEIFAWNWEISQWCYVSKTCGKHQLGLWKVFKMGEKIRHVKDKEKFLKIGDELKEMIRETDFIVEGRPYR